MKHRALTWFVLFAMLLGMAACGVDAALPTETPTMAQIATPTEAAVETKSTATAVPTKPAPTAVPVEVEEISFQSDHFNLVGDLQIPGTEGKHPVIIMVHGDGGINRTDSGKYRPIMERFLRAGYAVFSWDKPGTGESTGEFVDGAYIITDRASILVDAVELLKKHPAIDPGRIGVWGISQAGAVMPMALTMTDDIAFMIVVSGPGVDSIDQTAYLIGQQLLCQGYSEEEAKLAEQSYARVCKATTYQEYRENKADLIQFPYALNFTGKDILSEEDWFPWDRGVDAFFNPIEVIEQTTIPVLAFFGEKDTQVDPFQGAQAYEQALQKAGNQNSRVELIPNVNHVLVLAETGCMNEHRARVYVPEYLDLMEEWLAQLPTSLPPLSGSGGGIIAFTSERDGYEDIYVMNADGSDQRNITNHPTSDDTDPQWSPNGSQIAFASTRNGREDIYVMAVPDGTDTAGSNVRRLTHHSAVDADPTWSPDGTRIAFVSLRDGNVEIYVIDADGSNLQRLTHNSYNDFEIDWSPDGTHIAVSSQVGAYGNIYLVHVQDALQDPGGDDRQQLTDTEAHDAFPAWSPDGSRIAFISDREGQGNWEIYVMDADGSNLERLTYTDAIEGPPSWSPDGTQIVFESNRDGDFEIYVMAVDGTHVRRLTDNSVQDRNPDWRPSKTTAAAAGNSCECASLDPLQTQLVYDVETSHDAGFWSFSTPEGEGMDAGLLEAGVAALAEFGNLYSVLIVRNDKIVLERYFQGEDPRHARNIQSASKSFISTLVGIAIHEGYVQGVDQTAAEFLPKHFASVQDPRKLDITLRHLLTMTPGFSYQDNLYGLQGDWLAAAISYPLVSEPGSEFNYSTISSHILSAVLTKATGMSTCEFACQYLFQPIGITIDNWSRDPQGYYMGGVAMYFTPRELAKFGLLYLHDGIWNGRQVIPSEWIAESMNRHVNETGFPGVSYGYYWWRESAAGCEVYAAVGHGGQTIRIVPDLNLVVVTTADSYAPAQEIEGFPLLEEYVIPSIQEGNS